MTTERTLRAGFAPSRGDRRFYRHCGMMIQLIATLGLVISLAIAGTAITIGMAGAAGITTTNR